jgi:hypothetical protein
LKIEVWRQRPTGGENVRENLRRQCGKLVDGLDIPVPFDADVLCARVAAGRGRPLHLRAIPMPTGGPCGVWVSAAERDFIFFEAYTSGLHQEHIKLHELGHLLSNHQTSAALAPETSRLLLPNLDPAVVNRVLQRTHYTEHEEREAEMIASLILERANRWKPISEWTGPPEAADIRNRLGRTYEPPAGR